MTNTPLTQQHKERNKIYRRISGQCIKWFLIVFISFSCIWLTFANGSNYQSMIFVKSEVLVVGLETNTCNFNLLNKDN